MAKDYLVTLIVSPMHMDDSVEMFLQKRSFSFTIPKDIMINDVFVKVSNVAYNRNDNFEFMPCLGDTGFIFIDSKDIGGICEEIKQALDSFKGLSYEFRSPQETMNLLGVPGDGNQFDNVEDLMVSVFDKIAKSKNA